VVTVRRRSHCLSRFRARRVAATLALNLQTSADMKTLLTGLLLAIALVPVSEGYTPKYQVTVKADKHTDFSALKTYAWMDSHPAALPEIDAQIIAAVDEQLSALKMIQVPAAEAQVLATYASTHRTDVNTKAKPVAKDSDVRPEYLVGTIAFSLLEPATLRPLLQLRVDKKVDASWLHVTITSAVKEMFAKYPAPRHQ
jgi:hypothetical protein